MTHPSAPGQASAELAVRDLADRDELEDARQLLTGIWRRPDNVPPVQLEVLRATVHAGSMVLGGYRSGELVGVAIGFLGVVDGELHLHSHIVGVRPDVQGQGVGVALKWHQRQWCLDRGAHTMTWTFDPLVRRNAWVNVSKLGALGTEYNEDFYGEMPDELNAGLPTDRCLITWQLASSRVIDAAEVRLSVPTVGVLTGAGGRVVLDVDPDGEPVPTPCGAAVRLARVPAELLTPGHTEPRRALRWRFALRGAMGDAFAAGLALTAVTRDGWYVLSQEDS